MGMTKLKEIAEIFINEVKANLPMAIIQNGTLPEEKFVIGFVHNIVSLAKQQNISSPAIIVIGEVVSLHPNFENIRKSYLDNTYNI